MKIVKVTTPVGDSRANRGVERSATKKEIQHWLENPDEISDDERFYDEHGNFVFISELIGQTVSYKDKQYQIPQL